MSKHIMYIKPYSAVEDRLMELIKLTNTHGGVVCRLGSIFGLPYNEYELSHDTYLAIKNYLSKK